MNYRARIAGTGGIVGLHDPEDIGRKQFQASHAVDLITEETANLSSGPEATRSLEMMIPSSRNRRIDPGRTATAGRHDHVVMTRDTE